MGWGEAGSLEAKGKLGQGKADKAGLRRDGDLTRGALLRSPVQRTARQPVEHAVFEQTSLCKHGSVGHSPAIFTCCSSPPLHHGCTALATSSQGLRV